MTPDNFQGNLAADKQYLTQIDKMLHDANSIIDALATFNKEHSQKDISSNLDVNEKIKSQSIAGIDKIFTNAMFHYVQALRGGSISSSPFIADIVKAESFLLSAKATNRQSEAVINYLKRLTHDHKKQSNISDSALYGADDPFTLGWIYELALISNNKKAYENIRLEIIKRLYQNIVVDFANHNLHKLLRLDEGATLINATYPLLRLTQFYLTTKVDLKEFGDKLDSHQVTDDNLSNIREFFVNKLYKQLSAENIDPTNLDVAELIFAMEGVLLVDKEFNRPSESVLVERFFEKIQKTQHQTPFWQPVKPILIDAHGMLLLPFSTELASSLLRICSIYEKENVFLFTANLDMFKKYCSWLFTHTSRATIQIGEDAVDLLGWGSEYVNINHSINVAETLSSYSFLLQYRTMFQRHIAREALVQTNLNAVTMQRKVGDTPSNYWKSERECREPLFCNDELILKEYRSLKLIREDFIEPIELDQPIVQKFSMLLYGPPGTGKTSLAEDLAKSLEWDFITVTPSDFISHGSAQVEARAKSIFEALNEQSKTVILFDEIDHLLLDRNSEMYNVQGDMFQFMTPSMLVKIKNLRNAKQTIFIIATNYAEQIDLAIKRVGRIDHSFLILPPNKLQRQQTLYRHLAKHANKQGLDINFSKIVIDNDVLNKTLFATNSELGHLAEEAVKMLISSKSNPRKAEKTVNTILLGLWADKMPSPQVSLLSYTNRFYKDNHQVIKGQLPFLEFLLLLYLKYETMIEGKTIDERSLSFQEKKLITDVIGLLANEGCIPEENNSISTAKVKAILNQYLNDKVISNALLNLYRVISTR